MIRSFEQAHVSPINIHGSIQGRVGIGDACFHHGHDRAELLHHESGIYSDVSMKRCSTYDVIHGCTR
ncbi:hypothetical protein D3C86_807940 [compost metagenome]